MKRSFERISVDGQLSTNDTVILQCSGASDVTVAPESEDELRFGEALDAVLRDLALLIVRDGEGAGRVGRVVVRGGDARGRRARRAGGRELAARQDGAARRRPELGAHRAGGRRGAAEHDAAPRSTSRSRACRSAGAAPRGASTSASWPPPSRATRSSTRCGCPGEGAETEVFFSDLGHGYVTINAEYTT